jgi:mannose PTS system EIIA component
MLDERCKMCLNAPAAPTAAKRLLLKGTKLTMIGILIVSHRQLGDALIDCVEFIMGEKPESLTSVSIDIRENAADLRGKIEKGIKSVNNGKGVLILTDMFGGTPSNLSYAFLEEGHIEVISGVNLPIVIKAVGLRKDKNLTELAVLLEAFGKKSISLASGILKGNKRSQG